MKRLATLRSVVLLSAIVPAAAQAQFPPMPGTSFSLLLGLGGGGMTSISARDIESDKFGFESHGRVVGSLAVSNVVLDIGWGWFLSNLYGVTTEKTRAHDDHSEIYTRAGFGEFTASYRFLEDWLIGPSARYTYGTETSFSPTNFSDKTPRVHLGGRFSRQPHYRASAVRVGLFAYTDVNIDDRQITYAGVSLDFVLPIIKADVVTKEKIVEKETMVEVEKVVEKSVVVEKPVEKLVTQETYIHTLDGSMVNFETDKDVLLPESKEFLIKLGQALTQNGDVWTSLEIQGHTDERGEDAYNMDLSKRRAETVKATLIGAGVDLLKLTAVGYGESKPLDTAQTELAWARNRRVELVFGGVTDQARLSGIIESVRRASYMPQTCGPGGCK